VAVYTVAEVAERVHVSTDTIKRALKAGFLKGFRVGARGDWRIDEAELDAWIAGGAKTPPRRQAGQDDAI
jgi:excisionase family DNA binding protein